MIARLANTMFYEGESKNPRMCDISFYYSSWEKTTSFKTQVHKRQTINNHLNKYNICIYGVIGKLKLRKKFSNY